MRAHEEAFAVDGGHAAHAGCRDGLAVDFVGAVAGDEDSGDIGAAAVFWFDVAAFIHVDGAGEQGGIGDEADGDEDSGAVEGGFLPGDGIGEADAGDLVFADVEDFRHGFVP